MNTQNIIKYSILITIVAAISVGIIAISGKTSLCFWHGILLTVVGYIALFTSCRCNLLPRKINDFVKEITYVGEDD